MIRSRVAGRALLFVAVTAVTTGVLTITSADERTDVVTTSALRIVDANGVARITMNVRDGAARVSLFTEDGKLGCELLVRDTDSGIRIFDHGKRALSIFQRVGDGPPPDPRMPEAEPLRGLIAYDSKGAKRVTLTSDDSSASLKILGAQGGSHATVGATVRASSQAEVRAWSGGDTVFDRDPKRISLLVPADARPSAEVIDSGSVIWKAPGE